MPLQNVLLGRRPSHTDATIFLDSQKLRWRPSHWIIAQLIRGDKPPICESGELAIVPQICCGVAQTLKTMPRAELPPWICRSDCKDCHNN